MSQPDMDRYEGGPPALRRPVEVAPPAKRPVRPPALSANPDAIGLLKALRRRLGLALVLGVGLSVLVGGLTYLLVPRAKYTASGTLHVATSPKRIIFEPQERTTDYRTYQKTQITMLKNRKVLSHALAKPEIAGLETIREQDDADEWLEQNLKVDFPGSSEVLLVSLSGDRADDLAKIVNAVIKSYMTVVVEEEYRERVARLDALGKLRQKYDSELKLKRKSLRDTVAAVGASDQNALALAQQFKAEHLAMAQRELMNARSELLKAQSELGVLEAARPQGPLRAAVAPVPGPVRPAAGAAVAQTDPKAQPPLPAAIVDAVERNALVRETRGRLDKIAAQYQHIDRIARNKYDPMLVRLKTQYDNVSRELAQNRSAVIRELTAAQGGSLERPMVGSNGPTDLSRARSQLAVWTAYGEVMTKEVERLQGDLKETSDKGLDLENERQEITIASDVSRKVSAEVEAVQVELGAPERIKTLAEAKVPKKKDELRKLKAGGAAALGAFAFALLGVSYWEFCARRVDAANEVVDGLGLRLVGTLPAMPRKLRGPEVGGEGTPDLRWQNRLVESVDAMRAVLLHASRSEATRVVMVASALKGEGKTSLACHLSTSLARAGRKTLLIDCDLRSPACHRLFNLPAEHGVCEYLRGEVSLEDIIREGLEGGPSLIPAGRVDAMALQALSQEGLRLMIDDLRVRYDFIIVDSAPVLPVADSLLIGQVVDAVIFSVMRDVSRLPMVYAAHERLAALGVRMLGAVVSGVQDVTTEYEYRGQLG